MVIACDIVGLVRINKIERSVFGGLRAPHLVTQTKQLKLHSQFVLPRSSVLRKNMFVFRDRWVESQFAD